MTALLSVLVLAMGPFAVPADTPALCADQPGQIETAFDPGIGEQSACTADANCTEGPDVHCSGNATCEAVDQNCPYTQGFVKCDGNYTFCTACPEPPCTIPQCRQGCSCPGGISICVDLELCECDCIYQ